MTTLLQSLLIAIRALRVNKMRALLTMLGIIIGIAAVIAMVAIGSGASKMISDQIASIGSTRVCYSSYAGVSGPWFTYAWPRPLCGPPGDDDFAGAVSTMPGVIGYFSSTRLADITDGTSTTMIFGERAHGMIAEAQRDNYHFWFSGGNTAETLMSTTYPMNPQRRVKDFRWVASSDFDRYPFPDADQQTMDQLLGFSRS